MGSAGEDRASSAFLLAPLQVLQGKAPSKSFKVTCSHCGKELLTEVSPNGKDLVCIDCYNKERIL